MKLTLRNGLALCAIIVGLCAANRAGAAVIDFTDTSTGGGAKAEISLTGNTLSIDLWSLTDKTLVSDGNALSGIEIFLNHAAPSASLNDPSNSCLSCSLTSIVETTVGHQKVYSAEPSNGPVTHWVAANSGDVIFLQTVGSFAKAKPDDLIIGATPDAPNASMYQHTPFIVGEAQFTIDLSSSFNLGDIAYVKFGYGTTPTLGGPVDGVTIRNITSVPESSTWAMLLIGFVGLGYAGYRRASTSDRLALARRRQ
jgi:hypothetical protein